MPAGLSSYEFHLKFRIGLQINVVSSGEGGGILNSNEAAQMLLHHNLAMINPKMSCLLCQGNSNKLGKIGL